MTKKKAKAKKSTHKSTPHKPKHHIPRQRTLPGMEDAKIAAIENAALDYAEIRDQRQELTTQEVKLKERLLSLMHSEGKAEYKRNGISVRVVVEEETVKVRVAEEKAETDVEVKTEAPAA